MSNISAGILIIYQGKGLLVHSTNSPWWKSYTPPKGGVEKGEDLKDAASREVFEETRIMIFPKKLEEKVEIEYITQKGKLYKSVHIFIYRIESLSEIGLTKESVPSQQLQLDEIDEARFMNWKEAEKRMLIRYLEPLKNFFK